ncbi:hypothetical protein EH31_03635 [Erythrobacter longus]|uniref:Uncharacterized protein n=1 Tax=Erythrobacter longus TaxID=1044 RepID=A0A074MG46_ERYLO|nr:hypothetical protein [Erythrobacter longus]KEO91775.1 hypothetical protein EH31_03635 [Erythrobacter longus]
MPFTAALSILVALASPQMDSDTETRLRAAPIMVAHTHCSGEPGSEWVRVEGDDPYVTSVRDYWDAARKNSRTKYQQEFFRGVDGNGEPNGAYLQHAMLGTAKSGQHSCIIHFLDRAPEGVGKTEMELFSQGSARDEMIRLLWNETTWEVTLSPGLGYDFFSISTFTDGEKPNTSIPNHPFRGTQYRFLKLGAF